MNKEQLDKELKALEKDYEEARKAVIRKFIIENNPYEIGDIIRDHYHTIKIESWKYHINSKCAVYYGVELKKNLEPTKRQDDTRMWQSNVEEKIEPKKK